VRPIVSGERHRGSTRRSAALLGALLGALALLLAAPGPSWAAGRCGEHPWCDTSLTAAQRAQLLLAALTLDEKFGLMAGDDGQGVATGNPATGTSDGVPRLDVPTVYYSDGPVGPREGRVTAMPAPCASGSVAAR
jgi:beta-glucosidase